MITLHGMSKAQCELLDTMWAIDSAAEYEEWKSGLDLDTMNMVDTLEQMIMWAELDDLTDDECGKAKNLLDKFMIAR